MMNVVKLFAQILKTVTVDYVIECGNSGSWEYSKWKSGKIKASASIQLGTVSFSAVGNVYRGVKSITIPNIFDATPTRCICGIENPLSSIISINARALSKNEISIYIWKSTSGNVTIDDVAIDLQT